MPIFGGGGGGEHAIFAGNKTIIGTLTVTAGPASITPTMSVASATSAVLAAIVVPSTVITVTGNTAITTATGFNFVELMRPTYTAAGAVAISYVATLNIMGAPIAGGSATFVSGAYAIWSQQGANRFDGQIRAADGTAGAPAYSFLNATADGFVSGGSGTVRFVSAGVAVTSFDTGIQLVSTAGFRWSSGIAGAASDVFLRRAGAASLILGAADSATPAAYTLTIGESSRSGTDSNVAGSNGTVRAGAGTGNATGTSLFLQSAIPVASGAGAQTQTTGATIKYGALVLVSYIVSGLPSASAAGAGALAFVTDSVATSITGLGLAVTGSGANKVVVYSDGTNWLVI